MLFARWWSANSCELARIRTSWPTFTGGIGCRGLPSRGVLVEMRCSRSDGVLYRRWERDRRGSAGWMRLGERDAAGHGRSGVNGLHGYANRATECAFGTPLTRTSPTGMPEAQRSARVTHPFDGGGGVGGKHPNVACVRRTIVCAKWRGRRPRLVEDGVLTHRYARSAPFPALFGGSGWPSERVAARARGR